MKTLGYVRKIDELGRVVIPVEIRRKFDIDLPNATVEFFEDEKKLKRDENLFSLLLVF